MKTFQTAVITSSIRRLYQKRLLLPVIYLLFLAVVWFAAPISQLVFPHEVSSETPVHELGATRSRYILTTLTNLRFTGYTQKILGYTNGYYYYTFQDGQCIFVLLAPATCQKGKPDIARLKIRAHMIHHFEEYDTLTQLLAEDLDWTASGIKSLTPDYLLSEPGFHKLLSLVLLIFYFASGAYAIAGLILYAVYILFPLLAPPCRKLGLYGNAKELLAKAEQEVSCCMHADDRMMFFTEHFFIAMTDESIVIVPIQEIHEFYKRSTVHRFFSRHFSVSYTLHMTAAKQEPIQFSNVPESDISYILYAFHANK